MSSGIGKIKPAGADGANKKNTITFLCPNGHKLSCPMNMKGKTGKCPHCGTKFIIPEPQRTTNEDTSEFLELPEDDEPEFDRRASEAMVAGNAAAAYGQSNRQTEAPVDFAEVVGPPSDSGPRAIAALFARIWGQRQEGELIELYLTRGERMVPDWFAMHTAEEPCGMFAHLDNDGTYTFSAICWEAIQQISVRGMTALPEGLFE